MHTLFYDQERKHYLSWQREAKKKEKEKAGAAINFSDPNRRRNNNHPHGPRAHDRISRAQRLRGLGHSTNRGPGRRCRTRAVTWSRGRARRGRHVARAASAATCCPRRAAEWWLVAGFPLRGVAVAAAGQRPHTRAAHDGRSGHGHGQRQRRLELFRHWCGGCHLPCASQLARTGDIVSRSDQGAHRLLYLSLFSFLFMRRQDQLF